jgi:hypothetical protein
MAAARSAEKPWYFCSFTYPCHGLDDAIAADEVPSAIVAEQSTIAIKDHKFRDADCPLAKNRPR